MKKLIDMKTALSEVTFDQILSLVKKLPQEEKIILSKELEKDGINSKLTKLLKTFRTKELSLSEITEEVESVRQEIYEKQNR